MMHKKMPASLPAFLYLSKDEKSVSPAPEFPSPRLAF